MIRLYRTEEDVVVADESRCVAVRDAAWDDLFNSAGLHERVAGMLDRGDPIDLGAQRLRAPIGRQEVWAAGVTYLRSREARMEESAAAGGSDFYDKVYAAHRPELFFKATPHRVVGDGAKLPLRSDSRWNVPEPEMTLALNRDGGLVGYTIGNDLSSRDIEGENPLYLPQAKVWSRCAALGPGIVVSPTEPPASTEIRMSIERGDEEVFAGATSLTQMKQTLANLREHLFRDNEFPDGVFLMTGAGIVPEDGFTLASGDRVAITIEGVGELHNEIA